MITKAKVKLELVDNNYMVYVGLKTGLIGNDNIENIIIKLRKIDYNGMFGVGLKSKLLCT